MTERAKFSGRIGFILAAAGSAVGLGNIWRFPYLAGKNGGASFLVIYLFFIFFICFPIMAAEIAIGRKAGLNAYGSYKKIGGGSWGSVGILGILIGILVLSFYNVVAGWAFGYFIEIVFGDLLSVKDFGTHFSQYVADPSDNLFFSLGFMILTALIVSQGIQKGIEVANKIMMPGLYILLIALIVYSLTLPGAMKGVEFYLVPDLSEITRHTFLDGVRQAFFSLSLGMGALLTYGSYLHKDQNIVSSAAIITIADTMVAFLAGLMVFPLVFSAGQSPAEGPPLVFMILPKIFQDMGPILGRVVGGSFFLMLCFAALTSTISMLEVPTAYLVDEKKLPRKKTVWTLATVVFIMGLPSLLSQGTQGFEMLNKLSFYHGHDFMTFISDLADMGLTLSGFLLCIFVTYRWKLFNMHEELAIGSPGYMSSGLHHFINISLRFISPIAMGILFTMLMLEKFFGLDNIF
ncbi:MAG TPA: sodium-dependent transporter [Chitinophagaceae bacterium]|nr:sodium-dependent transporter [Chitinophagaceae bacterium]